MMKKLLSILLVLFLSMSFLVTQTKAQGAPFDIINVYIDGVSVNENDVLYVERGESINIMVRAHSNDDWPEIDSGRVDANGNPIMIDDVDHVEEGVKIEAEIDGYEYDRIDDVTEMFDIEYNVIYPRSLRLTIPDDIEASETYNLRIRTYNQDFSTDNAYKLRIKAERHKVDIQDVIFTPGLSLNADQPLFVTVRAENLGDRKEEDIKIEVSVPKLGRTGVTYIDELVPVENTNDDDEETSESSDAMYLDLRGAQPGTYDLIVKVEYNNGHDVSTKSYQLVISGTPAQQQREEVLFSATETSKTAEAGQGIVYKIDVANMGSNIRSFTAEVTGLDWGNYRVDPTITIVQPAGSAEMFVYVSPKEDVIGQRAFTVNVKEGNNVLKQINFQANIAEEKGEWGNVLTGLEIGFVVLLIILVILGIILAATRMGKKETSEEPLGESYY
jgi:hypothetical protein